MSTTVLPVLTEPARLTGCTCELTLVEVGETNPPAPLAPPIRFQTTAIVQADPDCLHHGHITRSTLAADLRYGD